MIRYSLFLLVSFLFLIGAPSNCFAQKVSEVDQVEVLRLLNFARNDGPGFVKKVVKPYLKKNNVRKTSYVNSLIRTLNKTKKVEALKTDKILERKAKEWALESGRKGTIGHGNIKNRLYSLIRRKGAMAENCTYGNYTPKDIVLDLLIDEGIPSLGHRKNILNPAYTKIGIGRAKHKRYGIVVVMDFSAR